MGGPPNPPRGVSMLNVASQPSTLRASSAPAHHSPTKKSLPSNTCRKIHQRRQQQQQQRGKIHPRTTVLHSLWTPHSVHLVGCGGRERWSTGLDRCTTTNIHIRCIVHTWADFKAVVLVAGRRTVPPPHTHLRPPTCDTEGTQSSCQTSEDPPATSNRSPRVSQGI